MAVRHTAQVQPNRLLPEDRAVHDWYRFVLSFPSHLVRTYVQKFELTQHSTVLDPFCGTGTVLVECKKLGIPSVGIEANPIAHFASEVKLDWSPDPGGLLEHAQHVAEETMRELHRGDIEDDPALAPTGPAPLSLRTLAPELQSLLLTDSVSPLPLHKTMVLLDTLARNSDSRYDGHERLALAKALATSISNLYFGPEVGVGKVKHDSPVVGPWLACMKGIAADLCGLSLPLQTPAAVHLADARSVDSVLPPLSVDAVITSPPYPNEKDYTRTTRLESVLLGFIDSKAALQGLKRGLVRSNTRGVYKTDDDDGWVIDHPEIEAIAVAIEKRRVELGKTSGFERLYPRVTKLYFGGMARHLAALRAVLRPGAQLAYVVGDQASYLRVMIRTGELLADIARSLGYSVVDIELFRTRLATATRQQLREEVVLLHWPGPTPRQEHRELPHSSGLNSPDRSASRPADARLGRFIRTALPARGTRGPH